MMASEETFQRVKGRDYGIPNFDYRFAEHATGIRMTIDFGLQHGRLPEASAR